MGGEGGGGVRVRARSKSISFAKLLWNGDILIFRSDFQKPWTINSLRFSRNFWVVGLGPSLLLTGRSYEAETCTILFLSFQMIKHALYSYIDIILLD